MALYRTRVRAAAPVRANSAEDSFFSGVCVIPSSYHPPNPMNGKARIAVGTARLIDGTPQHEAALNAALSGGINVVDTACSYGAGSSERLVGRVLSALPSENAKSIELLSKFGYFLQNGCPTDGASAPRLQHSMSSHFMQWELCGSLFRLAVPRIGGFLLDSPERALQPLVERRKSALGAAASVRSEPALASALEGEGRFGGDDAVAGALASAGLALAEGRKGLVAQLAAIFAALEKEVATGRVRCYGVSSDALVLQADDPLYLSWNDVIVAAEVAAEEVASSSTHSGLRVFQLPTNILEPRGAEVAKGIVSFYRSSRLRVMGMRPLTAVLPLERKSNDEQGRSIARGGEAVNVMGAGSTTWQRLVDSEPLRLAMSDCSNDNKLLGRRAPAPRGYMAACEHALDHFSFNLPTDRDPTSEEEELHEACRWLRQLLSDMNRQLVHFVSVAHYEEELVTQIMPMLNDKFEELDEQSAAVLHDFLAHYHAMVRFHAAQKTRTQVTAALRRGVKSLAPSSSSTLVGGIPKSDYYDGESLQSLALNWALEQPGLSNVVVGVTQKTHAISAVGLHKRSVPSSK